MAKVIPLFSSSKGNSYYIQGNDSAILIDAGRTCKQIENALLSNGLNMNNVVAVFVTHEHTDHCSGLRVLANRYLLPVFATKGTVEALYEQDRVDAKTDVRVIENRRVEIGEFIVEEIDTSHDARESCGYFITTPDDKKIALITDTGFILQDAREKACKSDLLIIESNHDIKMLDEGIYPFVLKKRIKSMLGHLSNEDCAKELPSFVEAGVKRIILAHLSEENNEPKKAIDEAVGKLLEAGFERDVDYIIEAAPVETNGKGMTC